MRNLYRGLEKACAGVLMILAGAGCVSDPAALIEDASSVQQGNQSSGSQPQNQNPSQGGPTGTQGAEKRVNVTAIQIQKDGMIAAGDGIIAFGSTVGGTTGVAFLRLGESTPVKMQGAFRGDAVYCTGKKVVVVADGTPRRISVLDTVNGSLNEIPGSDVFDIDPGANMENAYISVDEGMVAYWNRGGPNGAELNLADIRGEIPTVKKFTEPLISVSQVSVDGKSGQIALVEDNQYITVFAAASDAAAVPTRIDVKTLAGVPTAYSPKLQISGNYAVFVDFDKSETYLCNLTTQGISRLNINPSANFGTQQIALRGETLAYCLDRDTGDADAANSNRVASGVVTNPAAIAAANGTGNASTRLGFGLSLAISNDGGKVYVAGRLGQSPGGGVNLPSPLQVGFGETYALLTDERGRSVQAADVVAGSNVVAFKVAVDDLDIRLGYYIPD